MATRFKALSYLSRYLKMLEEDRPGIRVERKNIICRMIGEYAESSVNKHGIIEIYDILEKIDIRTQWEEYEKSVLLYGSVEYMNEMWISILGKLV